jgi:hypothetical protein
LHRQVQRGFSGHTTEAKRNDRPQAGTRYGFPAGGAGDPGADRVRARRAKRGLRALVFDLRIGYRGESRRRIDRPCLSAAKFVLGEHSRFRAAIRGAKHVKARIAIAETGASIAETRLLGR